jgi:hypothetical protein
MKNYILEVERNAEGAALAYMSAEGAGSGYRIAGPKAWGGSRNLATLKVRGDDLVSFIIDCAPEVAAAIAAKQAGKEGA